MSETRYVGTPNGRTLGEVIAEIKDELRDFMQTRVQMFAHEMRDKMKDSKKAAVWGAAGLLLLLTAYLLLNFALVGLVAMVLVLSYCRRLLADPRRYLRHCCREAVPGFDAQ